MPGYMLSNKTLPLWRSLLFVPAHQDKFVEKAHTRNADALVLDLEDSVPLPEKNNARRAVKAGAAKASCNGGDVLVRINTGWRLAVQDLEAAVDPAIAAIVVPKTSSAEHLQFVCELITELEYERGMKEGHTRLIALIETPAVLPKLDAIANATPRLVAMAIGGEDFSAAAGMMPSADSLLVPNQQLLFAARTAGILPLGFIGSIADYRDIGAFRLMIERARGLGFCGGFCIHPSQVGVMNIGYSPTEEDVEDARGLIEVYQRALANGRGAAEFRGKMIDAPVVERAREILQAADAIDERQKSWVETPGETADE